LAFLDADDLWIPEKLHLQYEEMITSKADLIFSKCFIIDEHNNKSNEIMAGYIGYLSGSEGKSLMIEINQIPILTALVKKEKIIDAGGFPEQSTPAEDYHLWLKLILNDNIFWGSDRILAYYRLHSNSSTANDKYCVDVLPAIYADLFSLYPANRKLLKKRLNKLFNEKYENLVKDKKHLRELLIQNTSLLNKSYLKKPLTLISYIFSLSISKFLINKILNG
jgi:hypothetical protein